MTKCCAVLVGVLLLSAAGLHCKGNEASDRYKNEKNLMLWDLAHYCTSKARDIYFSEKNGDPSNSPEEKKERTQPYLEMAKKLILELEEIYLPVEPIGSMLHEPSQCDQKPLDCSDVLKFGQTKSGVYTIWPAEKPLVIYCDMDTDGGGWTVIQRRDNFSVQEDFYRGWEDYKNGFGNVTRDFWLGNEYIHLIGNQSTYEIRFDLKEPGGNQAFAVYQTFWLDDESNFYTLHIGNYSGNAGDSMAYHDNHPFSTKDSEKSMCAEDRKAGWWYDYCTESNLNGLYQPGVESREGITWYSWYNHTSLAGSEIKLRKKND